MSKIDDDVGGDNDNESASKPPRQTTGNGKPAVSIAKRQTNRRRVLRTILLTGGVLLWRRYLEQQTKRLAFAQIPTELAALPLASGPAVLHIPTRHCAAYRFHETPAPAARSKPRQAPHNITKKNQDPMCIQAE